MDFYEFTSRGKMVVEVLNTLPMWKNIDVGRLIYSRKYNCLYICTNSISPGWITTIPNLKSINISHFDFDIKLKDLKQLRISAIHIPIWYTSLDLIINNQINNGIFAVQDTINNLHYILDSIVTGNYYVSHSIKLNNIDCSSSDRLDASNIFLENDLSYFGNNLNTSIESSLDQLYERTTKDILLSKISLFGSKLNSFPDNIQSAFETIEEYIYLLSANDISINLDYIDDDCKNRINRIQTILDQIFKQLKTCLLINMSDIKYDMKINQVLKSCINRTIKRQNCLSDDIDCSPHVAYQSAYWDWVWASEIECIYFGIINENSNLQETLYLTHSTLCELQLELDYINSELLKLISLLDKISEDIFRLESVISNIEVACLNFNVSVQDAVNIIDNINITNISIANISLDIDIIKQRCCFDKPLPRCECFTMVNPPYDDCVTKCVYHLLFYPSPPTAGITTGLNITDNISITSPCTPYDGTSISLTATPISPNTFVNWTISKSDGNIIHTDLVYDFVMTQGSVVAIANFLVPIPSDTSEPPGPPPVVPPVITAPVKKALLVAINKYPTGTALENNDLSGSIPTAQLYETKILPKCGFSSANITKLYDSAATRTNILNKLAILVNESKSGDTIFFLFVGHGSQDVIEPGNPSGETDQVDVYNNGHMYLADECLCYYTTDGKWWNPTLRDHQLGEILKTAPEGVHVVVVLECCHSGTGLRDIKSDTQPIVNLSRFLNSDLPHISTDMQTDRATPSYIVHTLDQGNAILISATSADSTGLQINTDKITISGLKIGWMSLLTYAMYIHLMDSNYNVTYRDLITKSVTTIRSSGAPPEPKPQLEGNSKFFDMKFLKP